MPAGRFSWERFLERVREHPYLYDTNLTHYKDSNLKDRQWVEIGQQFGITGLQAKNKWRNARDRYIKIRVQMKRSAQSEYSGMGITAPKIKWRYYQALDDMLRDTQHYSQLCHLAELVNIKTEPGEYIYQCVDTQSVSAEGGTSQDGELTLRIERAGPAATFDCSLDGEPSHAQQNDLPSSPEAEGSSTRKRNRLDDCGDDEGDPASTDEATLLQHLNACIAQLVAATNRPPPPPPPEPPQPQPLASREGAPRDECHFHGMSVAARLRRLDEATLPQVLHKISEVLLQHGV
ncbi:uncharacterized protein LOC144124826 isoform X1 [Amblyomma americanum]